MLLHRFRPALGSTPGVLLGALSAEQEARFRVDRRGAERAERPARLDALDEMLIAHLARDGRASSSALAAAAGTSISQASRRLERLQESGALVLRCTVSAAAVGLLVPAVLRIRVAPRAVREAGERLQLMPETQAVFATTGASSLQAVVMCRDPEHLFSFVADGLGVVPGVEEVTIAPVLEQVKQHGARLVDGLLRTPTPAG